MVAFFAATRQGLALIGPSTAAPSTSRAEDFGGLPRTTNFKPVVFRHFHTAHSRAVRLSNRILGSIKNFSFVVPQSQFASARCTQTRCHRDGFLRPSGAIGHHRRGVTCARDCARRARTIGFGDPSTARTPDPADGGTLHEEGQPEASR